MTFDTNSIIISSTTGPDQILTMMPHVHEGISEILSTYLDMDEDEKSVLTKWIMAAAYKDVFYAIPELFINASKGSGKTRLLKLIKSILPESIMVVSMTESSLFRLCAVKRCILIDEAENMGGKEKANLLDLLNVCYKRGGTVPRVEKVNHKGGGVDYQVKEYPVYMPVVLANVWGLDSVLEDKCITIVMERSTNPSIINMPEFFEQDTRITAIRTFFELTRDSVGSILGDGIVPSLYDYLHTLYNTYTHTQPVISYTNDDLKLFASQVYGCKFDGRTFELWMPLFVIAYTTSRETYTDFLDTARKRVHAKQEDELTNDRDTAVAVTIYTQLKDLNNFMETKKFIDAYVMENGEQHWLSSEWLGKFLKRAKVIKEKVRLGRGYRYEINMVALKKYLEARHALETAEKTPQILQGQTAIKTDLAQKPEKKEAPVDDPEEYL